MQWTIDILQVTGVDLQAGMKEAVIATMKMDHHIMTEDILNQNHQQSVGGVFLVHHKSLQSTRSKPVTGELILLEISEWFSLKF
jgi:hypothetical protein